MLYFLKETVNSIEKYMNSFLIKCYFFLFKCFLHLISTDRLSDGFNKPPYFKLMFFV